MRFPKKLAYPALGLMMAFGVHTTMDTPTVSAQCRYYYGTTNPQCYDEEIDSSPCIYYYGTEDGCRSRWNTTTDESAEPLPPPSRPPQYGYPYAPGNYPANTNDSVTNGSSNQAPYYGPQGQMYGQQGPMYGPQGQMYGPQGQGMYGGGYYGNQAAPYYYGR